MIIAVDPTSTVPPYEQVRAAIAEAVASRELAAGARLPTVRELAGNLALAANTVARAYRELEAAGIVETLGRRGTFVAAPDEPAKAAAEYAHRMRDLNVAPTEALRLARKALGLS